jgi:hypothetical protein
VDDHERDFDRLAEGGGKAEGIYYQVGTAQLTDGRQLGWLFMSHKLAGTLCCSD